MNIGSLVEHYYRNQVQFFEQSKIFQQLESGDESLDFYNQFIVNLCQTHLKSPQILAFLYSIAPPEATPQIKQNMLEELGLDKAAVCHPDLLYRLASAAGFDPKRAELTDAAQEQLRRMCTEPLMFGTIQELGLSVLLEVTCFEWMLSRLASRIGKALEIHRGLRRESLEWFYHHSEVDVLHAEAGLICVVQYVEYYEIDPDELETILDITFRQNIFIKRYFGATALAEATNPLEPVS